MKDKDDVDVVAADCGATICARSQVTHSSAERAAVYRAIYTRRDVRNEFLNETFRATC